MYAIAPSPGIANRFSAYAFLIRAFSSAGVAPASAQSICASIAGRTVRDAGGLKQCGALVCVFQNAGSPGAAANDRITRQVNPFGVSTRTVAFSEIADGAAVRASATSAARSAIR